MVEKWSLMFLSGVLQSARLRKMLSNLPPQALLSDVESAAMVLLFRRIRDELENQAAFWLEVTRLMLAECLWLLRRAGARPLPPPVINPLAKQIADYIDQEYALDLNMAMLSKRFGYSESHLSHTFKDHMQVGIKQYILQRRIAAARRVLEEDPNIKITAVAENVGFANFTAFNRNFKLLTGMTPAVYCRNLHQGSRI